MKLLPGIAADGPALFLEKERTLVLADLHIGFEEELRAGGVLIPMEQHAYFIQEFDRLFAAHNPARVILNGDIKHEFGRISRQEWDEVRKFVKHIREKGCTVEVVLGNHDNMLSPILDQFTIPTRRAIIAGSHLVVHGDITLEELEKKKEVSAEELEKCSSLIMGHEHPSLTLTDGTRKESVKCFLIGKFSRKDCIVMPAWNPLSQGVDVVRERPLGPLLASFRNFSAYALLENDVLPFGKVGRLR